MCDAAWYYYTMDPKKSSVPIFETVTEEDVVPKNAIQEEHIDLSEVDDTPAKIPVPQPALVPDDVPSEPVQPEREEITTTFDLDHPEDEGNHKTRIFIIIGGIIFFIVIFFILFKIVTSFLGGGSGIGSKKVTLTYWGLWEDKAVVEPLIKEYTKKNPNVTIVYEKKDPHSYREKLLARSKDGNGPDIFRFHNTWLPSIKDVLAPLPKAVLSSSEYESTFYPITKKDLKVGDLYYGIPLEIDGLVLLYNTDLFKQGGIAVGPKSWEDIAAYSGKLTVVGPAGIITSGIALGTAENIEHFSEILGLMLLQNEASLSDLTSKEAVEMLSAYRKLAQLPNARWDENMPNSISAFTQGKVAMIFVPSWEILTIKQIAPDLNFKVTSIPVVPGGKQITLANYWVEGVSKNKPAANQLESWKFIKFLSTRESLSKLFKNASQKRLFGEPYSRVDMRPLLEQDQYLGPVVQQAAFMESLPVISRTYDGGLNDAIVQYLKNAVNDTSKGVTDQEAFATANQGIHKVLTQFGIK